MFGRPFDCKDKKGLKITLWREKEEEGREEGKSGERRACFISLVNP